MNRLPSRVLYWSWIFLVTLISFSYLSGITYAPLALFIALLLLVAFVFLYIRFRYKTRSWSLFSGLNIPGFLGIVAIFFLTVFTYLFVDISVVFRTVGEMIEAGW